MICLLTGCIVLTVLIAVLAFRSAMRRWDGELAEALPQAIMSLVVGTIVSFMVCFIVSFIGSNEVTYDISHQEIVSLVLDKEMQGSFVLGCGNFGGQEYYVYFCKRRDGGYSRRRIRVDDAIIHEFEDTVVPRVEWQDSQEFPPTWVWPWTWPNLCGGRNRKTVYFIEVPKGTIIRRFEL